ncbi:phage protein Gp27 family protein, partial [Lentimonas sp. CC6]
MTKKKRIRSKIELLPQGIREALNLWLRNGDMTQQDVLGAIHEMIDEAGLPKEAKPSYTSLNRYARRMEDMGARLRQSREVA